MTDNEIQSFLLTLPEGLSLVETLKMFEQARWVRTDDEMPKEGRYIVTVENQDGNRKVTLLGWKQIWSGQKVIAYQPLPAPFLSG